MDSIMPPPNVAPGYYPDPEDDARYRYWDGTAWLDRSVVGAPHTHPTAPTQTPPPPVLPAAGRRPDAAVLALAMLGVLGVVGLVIGAFVVLGLGPGDGSSDPTTLVTAGPTRPSAPDGAIEFQGRGYTIMIDPTWRASSQGGTRLWYTGGTDETSRDILSVRTEQAGDVSLDEYVSESIQLTAAGLGHTFEVLARRTILLSSGESAVRVAAKAELNGRFLRFVIITTKDGDDVAIVTFAAPVTRFDVERDKIEPYMATLTLD